MMDVEKPGGSGLVRTKSEQLVETLAAAFRSPSSNDSVGAAEGGGTLSRTKSSKRLVMAASPGRGGAAAKSSHIRKSRSAQMKYDLEDLMTSSAALSRASSASLGLSFSFTGFTMPPDDAADSKPFSDEDIRK